VSTPKLTNTLMCKGDWQKAKHIQQYQALRRGPSTWHSFTSHWTQQCVIGQSNWPKTLKSCAIIWGFGKSYKVASVWRTDCIFLPNYAERYREADRQHHRSCICHSTGYPSMISDKCVPGRSRLCSVYFSFICWVVFWLSNVNVSCLAFIILFFEKMLSVQEKKNMN